MYVVIFQCQIYAFKERKEAERYAIWCMVNNIPHPGEEPFDRNPHLYPTQFRKLIDATWEFDLLNVMRIYMKETGTAPAMVLEVPTEISHVSEEDVKALISTARGKIKALELANR